MVNWVAKEGGGLQIACFIECTFCTLQLRNNSKLPILIYPNGKDCRLSCVSLQISHSNLSQWQPLSTIFRFAPIQTKLGRVEMLAAGCAQVNHVASTRGTHKAPWLVSSVVSTSVRQLANDSGVS